MGKSDIGFIMLGIKLYSRSTFLFSLCDVPFLEEKCTQLVMRVCVFWINLAMTQEGVTRAVALSKTEVRNAKFPVKRDPFTARLFKQLSCSIPFIKAKKDSP